MTASTDGFDRAALSRSFGAAAATYEASAHLQQRVRAELLQRLEFFALSPKVVVDLGAGTGQAALQLQRRYREARVLAVDIAPAMLAAAPRPMWRRRFDRLCADAHALPLASSTVDLVFSNLMLQWSDALPTVCAEVARVLRPGGLLVFSTLGPDTLHELRAAWAAADDHQHVSGFPDMPLLGDALMRGGLAEPVMDVEHTVNHYPDAFALMHELKRLGAHNAARARARGLTGRSRLRAMLDAYEGARTPRGLPATYEIIYGAAFGTHRTDGLEDSPSHEYAVPVAQIRRKP